MLAISSKIISISLLLTLGLSACSMPNFRIPRVHRITIQQGNLVTQDMIDKLKPGMSKKQVSFVLGQPVVQNPFNQDRWDYIYTIFVQPNFNSEKRLSVFFVDEHLSHFTGDFVPTDQAEQESELSTTPNTEKEETADSG